jgi:signal transduction protein with GAF and PtsI domain
LISDLFEATQSMQEHADLRDAARYVLELAMETIPSDSGAVFISDINRADLYFAAAAGPKADDVMSFRVPMGQGIVGFSAQAGVSLAVSDVHKDPRFYAKISQALGYETHSIVCSPAQQGGRVFGAIELINKKSGSSYTADEVNILNYLAHALADYLITTGQTGD